MGLKVVYFGTPDFAVASLEAIVASTHEVVGVVTAPDKPAGRGMQLRASAVKEVALKHQLPLAQPPSMKAPEFHDWLEACNADIFVVVAFRMMPQSVWSFPPMGTFNLHGSLLPKYRGAAPINWAIINGETTSGITTFFLKHEIDTGNVIEQVEVPVDDTTTFGGLYNDLKIKGAELVVKTLDRLLAGDITPIPQEQLFNGELASLPHAPKLNKSNTKIDWSKSGKRILRFCHGLNPFPGAWCQIEDAKGGRDTFKLFEVTFTPGASIGQGKVMAIDGKLQIGTQDGNLNVIEAQLPGKKRMSGKELANGLQGKSIQLS